MAPATTDPFQAPQPSFGSAAQGSSAGSSSGKPVSKLRSLSFGRRSSRAKSSAAPPPNTGCAGSAVAYSSPYPTAAPAVPIDPPGYSTSLPTAVRARPAPAPPGGP